MKSLARKDVISSDEFFMGIAVLAAQKSKFPEKRVGAVIVDKDGRIVSVSHNDAPRGWSEETFFWNTEGNFLEAKEAYNLHAERNAIYSARCDLRGCTLYTVHYPCNECTKSIIQSGISEVVYMYNLKAELDRYKASKIALKNCGVKERQIKPKNRKLVIDFDEVY